MVVVEGLKAGTDMLGVVTADNSSFRLKSKMDIPIGHKVALSRHQEGRHGHRNTARTSARRSPTSARASTSTSTTSRPSGGEAWRNGARSNGKRRKRTASNLSFMGWRRENGRVGVRNHVVILPLDDLSNAACEAVANNIKGTLALPHAYGRLQFGEDLDLHLPHADRHRRQSERRRRRRDRHRGRLDQARGRRHRQDRQAGDRLRHRGPRRHRHHRQGLPRRQGIRADGPPSCSARSATSPISGSRPSAARATPPPASPPARPSATCTTS